MLPFVLALGMWDGAGGGGTVTPTDQWWRSVAAQSHTAGSVNGDAYVAGAATAQGYVAGSVTGESA